MSEAGAVASGTATSVRGGRPRYAYLGPAGTFTEAALRQVVTPDEAEYLPQTDVGAAIEAVRSGDADFAVTPRSSRPPPSRRTGSCRSPSTSRTTRAP